MTYLSDFFASADSGIPVGSIVAGPAVNPFPSNYLPCDGKTSYANASYPSLSGLLLPSYSWQAVAMAATQTWSAVVYGGGTWLAIATGTRDTETSTDGINWTAHTNALPATGYFLVAWNGSVFCAIGAGTAAATSSDGITWTSRTLPSANFTWKSIVWNGTYFVLASSTKPVVTTSPTGTTWSALKPVTAYSTHPLSALAANASTGQVVASISSVNASAPAFSTTDTINWSAVSATFTNNTNPGIPIWNGTVWLMLPVSTNSYMTSADGLSWVGRHVAFGNLSGASVPAAAAALTVGATILAPVGPNSGNHNLCIIAADGIVNSCFTLGSVAASLTLVSGFGPLASDGSNFVILSSSSTVAFYGTYDSSHFYTPNLSYAGSYYIKAS